MTSDPRTKTLAELKSEPLFNMVVDLNPRLDIGGPLG